MASAFLICASAFMSIVFGAVDYDGCKFELTDTDGITAEYDLFWFHREEELFVVGDTQNEKYKYAFNICGAIEPELFTSNATIPSYCAHPGTTHGPCISEDCTGDQGTYEPTSGRVPSAVQINAESQQCMWLGMEVESVTDVPEYKMELLNPRDAGKGVRFTILNGEYCEVVGRNRELRINLECPDDPRLEFDPMYHIEQILSEEVDEVDTCIYELNVKSANACPNKCVLRAGAEFHAICGTHGICESDPYGRGEDQYPNGTVRCLCDDGYTGDMCETVYNDVRVIDQTHPGLLAAIIICIVLLGISIVCAAILCHKIRMKEYVDEQSMKHLAGGMLEDENDAAIDERKANAVSMNIGSTLSSGGSQVQLQTVDDQLEKDKVSELLGVEKTTHDKVVVDDDDDEDEEDEVDETGEQNEEEEDQ